MLDFHCEGINMWGLIHREVLPFFCGSCTLFRINCSKFGFLSKNKRYPIFNSIQTYKAKYLDFKENLTDFNYQKCLWFNGKRLIKNIL